MMDELTCEDLKHGDDVTVEAGKVIKSFNKFGQTNHLQGLLFLYQIFNTIEYNITIILKA